MRVYRTSEKVRDYSSVFVCLDLVESGVVEDRGGCREPRPPQEWRKLSSRRRRPVLTEWMLSC